MGFLRRLFAKFVLPVLLVSGIFLVAATTFLFTQTFPPVPIVELIISPHCSTLALTPNPNPVTRGDSGFILGQCNMPSLGSPAFSSIGGPGLVAANFTLPSFYTALAIIQHTNATSSDTSSPGYNIIISGETIPAPPRGGYDYCVTFVDAPPGNLSPFTVTWSQQTPT